MTQVSVASSKRPQEYAMGTIRTLAAAALALSAILMLTQAPVRAEPQASSTGAPLRLSPPPRHGGQHHRVPEIKKIHHAVRVGGAPAGRIASHKDGRNVMRGSDTIGLLA